MMDKETRGFTQSNNFSNLSQIEKIHNIIGIKNRYFLGYHKKVFSS